MYFKRLIENQISEKLKYSGAILIAGPKFCGKTTTSELFAKSKVKLITDQDIELAKINDNFVFQGSSPRLIDEWQVIPDIWNKVRSLVDEKDLPGLYILTGSSTPADKTKIHHSGAGRITTLKMKSLTLTETLENKNIVSLKKAFDGIDKSIFFDNKGYDIEKTAFYICRGGWPKSVLSKAENSLKITKDYYDGLFEFESSPNKKFRNKKKNIFKMILKSYARNISTEASYNTMIRDIELNENRKLDIKTFDEYIEALQDIFIIEDIEAWNTNLRSKTAIRSTNTRHFYDTSIACQALNISPNDLLNDVKTFGFFFEDFAIKELSVYASLLNGKVMHYRDANGLECDAIIHLDDGRWGMIEIKLGSSDAINAAATNLNNLDKRIDYTKFIKPSFKMILTAFGPTYVRPDGIIVTSINCLTN
ncbi:MAG: ATP-binding protein [Lachnospiraceae bacterium]|nr:ATP-binding protein [Lachnospiraceae bacterium]